METQIRKFGNSRGIIIPASVLKILDLKENSGITIRIENNQIILSKKEEFNPQSLEELFIDFIGNEKTDIIFDDDKGRETW